MVSRLFGSLRCEPTLLFSERRECGRVADGTSSTSRRSAGSIQLAATSPAAQFAHAGNLDLSIAAEVIALGNGPPVLLLDRSHSLLKAAPDADWTAVGIWGMYLIDSCRSCIWGIAPMVYSTEYT